MSVIFDTKKERRKTNEQRIHTNEPVDNTPTKEVLKVIWKTDIIFFKQYIILFNILLVVLLICTRFRYLNECKWIFVHESPNT